MANGPQPDEPFALDLNETCLDCGKQPIEGIFVYYARAPDPEEFRARVASHGVADVRVIEDVVCILNDWNCRDEKCRAKKTYDPPPVTRLAARANVK